jgi:hypothetical protein
MPTTDANILRDPMSSEHLNEMRDKLRKRAYLYESPDDFRAGVEAAVNTLLRESRQMDLDLAVRELELDQEIDLASN